MTWIFLVCCQVIMQLEACGIVETIHISAAGFPIRWNVLPLLNSSFIAVFIALGFYVNLSFLLHRIPFKSFIQRYGLISKYSKFNSGTPSVGEYSLSLDPFMVNFGMFTVGKQWFYFLSLGLLVYSPFTSLALLVNLMLSSLLSLGLLNLVYKNRTF